MEIAGADLWRALPIPAFLLNPDGTILAANPAAEEFLNLSARALVGQGLFAVLATDPEIAESFRRMAGERSALFINDVETAPSTRPRALCNLQATAFDTGGATLLLTLQARDPVDRPGQGAGGGKSARSVIGMADLLAHEIKNPLAGIAGAAQLLAMELPPEGQELTGLIVSETHRIVKMLEQVEQFGHMRPPVLQPVNIHDILDRARRSALLGFAADMTISEEYDPSLPPVLADADHLTQVFLNLLKNAAEACAGRAGAIRLRSFYDPSLRLRDGATSRQLPIQIEVIDNGPGIPPALLPEIFAPFVSGRENGSGLGLALVSQIVSGHGGWIGVESRPGRTLFRVALRKA